MSLVPFKAEVRTPMLDSCPNNGNPYSPRPSPRGRRRSSSAQRFRQFPDVVAEVMARHSELAANLHGDLGRSSSNREESSRGGAINSRGLRALSAKHMVERSQSQLSRPSARVLPPAECQRRSRRSYDAQGHRSAEHLADKGDEQQSPPQMTLVMMGAPEVGKSTLVNQFLWEAFLAEYRPTVEEFNWVEYGRADRPESNFLLQVIDSSGSRDFLAMRHLYYRIGDAFMVVYAANDAQSYAEALAMLREISKQNSKEAPILLVENKGDLVTRNSLANLIDAAARTENTDPETQRILTGVRRMRLTAKNLEQVKGAFWWLIEELVRRSQMAAVPVSNGRPVVDAGRANKNRRASNVVSAGKAALTRRRQSMPSRRTASELGIDEEALKRLVKKHETQSRHGCIIQ